MFGLSCGCICGERAGWVEVPLGTVLGLSVLEGRRVRNPHVYGNFRLKPPLLRAL